MKILPEILRISWREEASKLKEKLKISFKNLMLTI
jgi:hypothetical protein